MKTKFFLNPKTHSFEYHIKPPRSVILKLLSTTLSLYKNKFKSSKDKEGFLLPFSSLSNVKKYKDINRKVHY